MNLENKLSSLSFDDPGVAATRLRNLPQNQAESEAFSALLPGLLQALGQVAYPDRVLINLEKLCQRVPDRKLLFETFISEPRALETVVVLFAGSQFLSDVLINNPGYLGSVKTTHLLTELKTRHEMFSEASDYVAAGKNLRQRLDLLRRLQKRELLRIGSGDLLGILNFQGVVNQISNLARAMIRNCLHLVSNELGIPPQGFAVIALGKLGGRELNYSSDVDLIFVSREAREEYKRLAQRLIQALARPTKEGFLYRIDMRLRPWGQVGTLVPTATETLSYLQKHAQLWEKQAMRKARRVAGDDVLGIEFLDQTKQSVARLPAGPLREEILRMKATIEVNLRKKGQMWGEVKRGEGSIRDVEFVTQYLQVVAGRKYPEIQSRNTLDALARLGATGLLPPHDHRILAEGYVFLRTIEHHLQIMHYRQTHLLPSQPRELDFLANRLGFQGKQIGGKMLERYLEHTHAIRKLFDKYLLNGADIVIPVQSQEADAPSHPGHPKRHLERMDTSYSTTFERQEILQHAEMATGLTNSEPVHLHVQRLGDTDWRLTVVALDAFGELSLICGLLFDYGFDILSGTVFTYEPEGEQPKTTQNQNRRTRRVRKRPVPHDSRRKIVDVFTLKSTHATVEDTIWRDYEKEVNLLVRMLRDKKQSEVHGELAKRVARVLMTDKSEQPRLFPVEVSFDNSVSDDYTVLRLDAPDTRGFLFEFANALSLNGIHISKVVLTTLGNRVHDTFYVTDIEGSKITEPKRQYQLRAATVLVKHFTHLLPQSPNPMSAILHFRQFLSHLFTQEDWSEELLSLERPEVLSALSRLLGVSDFLWNDFLRMQHANLFPLLKDVKRLALEKTCNEMAAELRLTLVKERDWPQQVRKLNAYKDAEMFRIDMRYIMGAHEDFRQFSSELSDLAELIISTAYALCRARQIHRFGKPTLPDGRPCRDAVFSLGKLGGRELGIASDLELLFVYEGAGVTDGRNRITNNEFFVHLVKEFRCSIESRHRGIFELDLRMRPYGKGGNLAVDLSLLREYYAATGPAWDYERQALVRLRPVAGDTDLGEVVVALREQLIYAEEQFAVPALRAMRERQVRQLVAGGGINAKFSPGGLVDLEYLVQGLQIKNGAIDPAIRTPNTEKALLALQEKGIFSQEEYEELTGAYSFLRRLIEALRMVRGHAEDLTLPKPDSDEFQFLARRLDYDSDQKQLFDDLLRYTGIVEHMSKQFLQ